MVMVVVNEVVTKPTTIDNTKLYPLYTIPSDRTGKVTKIKIRNYGNGAELLVLFYAGTTESPEYLLADVVVPNNSEIVIDFPIYFEEVISARTDAVPGGAAPTGYSVSIQLVVEEHK